MDEAFYFVLSWGLPEISREKLGANKFILQVASFFPTSKRF